MVAAANLGVVLVLLLVFLCFLQNSDAIWLSLPASGTKCISEEIQSNVVVLADYVVISDDHVHSTPAISAKVTSPYGNTLHHQENVTRGQFAFTTTEGGNYLACFWGDGHNTGGGDISVNIEWKTGIAAKDWDSVARKEKIEGVELELRKLEGAVEAIHENLLYLKTRSRDANCKRNDKRSCGLVQSDVTRGLHYGFTCPNMALKTIFSKEKADLEVEGEEKGKVYVFDLVLY